MQRIYTIVTPTARYERDNRKDAVTTLTDIVTTNRVVNYGQGYAADAEKVINEASGRGGRSHRFYTTSGGERFAFRISVTSTVEA